MKKLRLPISILFILFLSACKSKPVADLILYNGHFITFQDEGPEAEVLIVKDGKIIALGGKEITDQFDCPDSLRIDLQGNFVYPGFIDAHCHFMGYARSLLNCDLSGTKSWEEVIERIRLFSESHPDGWLVGRGWDQNDWEDKSFPGNAELNRLFPNRPILLRRVDGHAAIANAKALAIAKITLQSRVSGGEVEVKNGQLTGVLVDNAVDLVTDIIPPHSPAQLLQALQQAEQDCYAAGLTTLADAGLDVRECLFLDSLEQQKKLSIFLYLMLNPTDSGLAFARKGVYENEGVRIGSFKLYADGALGSRGAKLKEPYCDRSGHSGFLIQSPEFYRKWCESVAAIPDYQINTHCIGDSAVKLLLETYGSVLNEKNDRRWRIEHAQVVSPEDRPLFAKYSIVPSVQPTHAVSDGPWAEDRLCSKRMPGAYSYKDLLSICGYLPLGTDFPVEAIYPLRTWYAAVFRGAPEFEDLSYSLDQSISGEEALKGMTLWAAKACKLEHRKGQLSIGKDADIVVLNQDLRTLGKENFNQVKVLKTIARGKKVYELPN